MTLLRPAIVTITIIAVVAAISLTPRGAETAFPGTNGRIVYIVRVDTNDYDIWSVNPDGSDPQELVTGPYRDYNPAVSPDGTKIAFSSSRDTAGGSEELYVSDIDGNNIVRLTDNDSYEFFPAWSPDGQSLAFGSDRDGDEEIFVMPAVQGGAAEQLTDNDLQDSEPAWSPDGTKIAFTRHINGGEIWTMDSDGDNEALVPNGGPSSEDPDWSPDGSMLAFRSYRDGPDQIYTMTSTGQNVTNILPGDTDFSPRWSPDGAKIAFVRDDGNGDQIWVMKSDGGDPEQITFANDAYDPSWAVGPATPTPTPSPTLVPTDTPGPTETATPTLSPTPEVTVTPTPDPSETPAAQTVAWADGNCTGEADPVDSLLTLRHNADLGANTGDCPAYGTPIEIVGGLPASAATQLWGDADCSEEIDAVDSLKVLRHDAGLDVTSPETCPDIESEVQITIP